MPGQDSTPQYLREQADNPDGVVQRGFYNIQDGQKGRDGGPYLDHIERQQAEIQRAYAEDREPEDLNGPLSASTGTMQVVAQLVPDNPYSNPSMLAAPGLETSLSDETYEADHLADPLGVYPVDLGTEPNDDTPESGSPVNPSASSVADKQQGVDGSEQTADENSGDNPFNDENQG